MPPQRRPTRETRQWFLAQCSRSGLTATQQRREIYDALCAVDGHPDAETIYQRVRRRMPAISLDTVYRNLRTLAAYGMVQKIGTTGDRAYYDANLSPHHHFVCTACGRIQDFYDPKMTAYRPPPDAERLGAIHALHIELRGTCANCGKSAPNILTHAGIEHA